MKVSRLIEELQKHDPDSIVLIAKGKGWSNIERVRTSAGSTGVYIVEETGPIFHDLNQIKVMEADLKAIKMVDVFLRVRGLGYAMVTRIMNDPYGRVYLEEGKQCALICVEEILAEYDTKILSGRPSHLEACKAYWQNVKSAIEKL